MRGYHLLLFAMIPGLLRTTPALAVIRFVPDDFMGIQQAIDGINSNDTIVIRNGTYSAPFVVWARNVTIASEFLLDADTSHISGTIIRPRPGDPEHRCFGTDGGDSTEHLLRMVGLTFDSARAINRGEEFGGGLYLANRTGEIRDCVFQSCLAGRGGAVYARNSNLTLTRCFFRGNDAVWYGRILYGQYSHILFQDCDLGPSGDLYWWDSGWDHEIQIDGCGIEMRNTLIHNLGGEDGDRALFRNRDGLSGLYLRLYGCTIENNFFWSFLDSYNESPRHLVIDSCLIRNNLFWFYFLRAWSFGGMTTATITRNTIIDNSRPQSESGIFSFGGARMRFAIEENYLIGNNGSSYACVGLRGGGNPHHARVQRNYFANNTSSSYDFGHPVTIHLNTVGPNVLEYNRISPNVGYGVYAEDRFDNDSSYALHNFWGDSTGPYEATRNPGGRGDTTNANTIYDPWLQSEEEIPDTSLYPPPQGVEEAPWPVPSMWYLANVYPNPFNGEFRVDLAGITGLDFTLKLYDILGREVALLRSGPTVRGTMAFQIPSQLAAGVYFLHARDHMYAETKKLLYLK